MEAVLKAMIPKGFILLERQGRNKPTTQKETPRKGACLITWPQVEGGEKKLFPEYCFYQAHTHADVKSA